MGVGKGGHSHLGRQRRESFLEEAAAEPMKGESLVWAEKGEGHSRAAGPAGAEENNLQ